MAETVHAGQTSSLRRLVPRIFSRSQRRDDVEQLIRTVR
jgi:GTP pyrophosphokinase